jgi:hypothetical protein
MSEIFAGSYDTVQQLETLLRKAGYAPNMYGEWVRQNSPILIIEGSRINGFYVAELRK